MGNIILLDDITANKIAAGEVVERPASVVKEMIENSIDAKATSITVEIENGGISKIKIIDNGTGIAADDMEIAFERHSTSKIRSAIDLDKISTLGFRGEALASISSVSKVELVSRESSQEQGMFVRVEGGKLVETKPIGCPIGTTFIIRDLFYNTPARYKFLKKDSTEAGYILDIVSRIALAREGISFKFVNKGKTVLHTPGNGDLKSAIFSIYGKDVSDNLLEVGYEGDNIKIRGFVGKPEIARGTRNHQSLYLNRRYIKSKIVLKAVEEAYKTFLMKGKYPFYVLDIEIDPLFVDVNVHPSKMEVRFSDEQQIFRSVYNAVNDVLLNKSSYRELPKMKNERETSRYVQSTFIKKSFDDTTKKINKDEEAIEEMIREDLEKNRVRLEPRDWLKSHGNEASCRESNEQEVVEDYVNEKSTENECRDDCVNEEANYEKNQEGYIKEAANKSECRESCQVLDEGKNLQGVVEHHREDSSEVVQNDESVTNNLLIDCTIIGQLFRTYILLQRGDDFYIIDQHAAHERVMFEKLKDSYMKNKNMSQELIDPIVVEMQVNEVKKILTNCDKIKRIGFEVEEFGSNALIIRGVPAFSDEENIKQYFLETVDKLVFSDKDTYNVDEALYGIACKSAIKAHKKMDNREIYDLLVKLDKLKNPFTCPHGRPTAIKLTKHDIEKMFKRIV